MSKASFNEAMTKAGFDSEGKISKANLAACLNALKEGHPNPTAVTGAIHVSRYVMDGRYRIDNNGAENAVRPLALGRKNYLFCRNHETAYHTAVVYSLLGTCRMWETEPVRWLTDVLSRIQDCSVKRLEELLPHRWKPQD